MIGYLPKGIIFMPVSVTSFTNLRRPRSKQSARHVKTQLPTARSSFSKSPEVSRSMVSSIWKPEMVMYLSNTAKQTVLCQGTANIAATAPQFRTMPPVCHYPQLRCYTVTHCPVLSPNFPSDAPSLHLGQHHALFPMP